VVSWTSARTWGWMKVLLFALIHTNTKIIMQATPPSTRSTRWNLVISEQTNLAVRSFLAQRGFKKGDLSNFVEDAVRWRVLDQTITQARAGFDAIEPQEAENLLDEALSEVRQVRLLAGAYAAFTPRR